MTMYPMSDVHTITVPTDVGGCGIQHELAVDLADRKLDCLPCEAWLQGVPSLGWANHPGGVALTPDEITANAQAEKKAQQAGWQNLAGQIAAAASGLVPAAQAQQPSLVEQILALDPTQKQALLVLLGAVPAPALEQAATIDAPATEPAAEQPKRAGGRAPRKQVPAAASAA